MILFVNKDLESFLQQEANLLRKYDVRADCGSKMREIGRAVHHTLRQNPIAAPFRSIPARLVRFWAPSRPGSRRAVASMIDSGAKTRGAIGDAPMQFADFPTRDNHRHSRSRARRRRRARL